MIEYGIVEEFKLYPYSITLVFKKLSIESKDERGIILTYYYKDIQFAEYEGDLISPLYKRQSVVKYLYKKRSVLKYNSYDIIFKLNKDGYYIEKDEEREEYNSIIFHLFNYYIISLKEQV